MRTLAMRLDLLEKRRPATVAPVVVIVRAGFAPVTPGDKAELQAAIDCARRRDPHGYACVLWPEDRAGVTHGDNEGQNDTAQASTSGAPGRG